MRSGTNSPTTCGHLRRPRRNQRIRGEPKIRWPRQPKQLRQPVVSASELLRAAADAVLAVALAPNCAACARLLDHPADGPVCAQCWSTVRVLLAPLCRTCGDPLPSWRTVCLAMEQCARCRRHDLAIACGRAAGEYEGSLREIIHAFKYRGTALARMPPRDDDARSRQGGASRRALCRARSAAPVASNSTRLQSGRGFGSTDASAGRTRALAPPGNHRADGSQRRGATAECPRCVPSVASAVAATTPVPSLWPRRAVDRRRENDRRHARGLCTRAQGRRRPRGARADGGPGGTAVRRVEGRRLMDPKSCPNPHEKQEIKSNSNKSSRDQE